MELICVATMVLCLAKGVEYDVTSTAEYKGAELRGRGWSATVNLWSHVVPTRQNPNKLSKACSGDVCISYLAHCDRTTCHIELGPWGMPSIDIRAKNSSGLRRAMASLAVNFEGPIPLAVMTERSPFTSAACRVLVSDPTSRFAKDSEGRTIKDEKGRLLRTGFAPVWEPGCEQEDEDFFWRDQPPSAGGK